MKLTPFFLAVILCVATSCSAAERKWIDNSGRFSVTAELVSVADGKVTLKRSDGRTVTLPVSRLSKADQEFLRSTLAAKKDSRKENRKSDPVKIQGIWMIKATWINGKKNPPSHADCFRISKDTIQAGAYGDGKFHVVEWAQKYKLDETKTPKRFDKYGVYSLDGDKLVLCNSHAGYGVPKSIPKEGKKGDNLQLYVLTRVTAKNPGPKSDPEERRPPAFQSVPATPRG